MNQDALIAELQNSYYLVKAAMDKLHFERPGDYEMFLAAGFRSAWASSWQRAGRAVPGASGLPSTSQSTSSNASVTVPAASGAEDKLPEVPDPHRGSGAGAQAFLAELLRTHALTASQYKALCSTCAIQYPAKPNEQDVKRLSFEQCVAVLCGGR